ncbi:MAG: hypothetical protein Q9218_004884 [Villophora microphyllina]
MARRSDDFTLTIRQAPERGKVAAAKEKDGGFFVFGDLSVKTEGEFRLRFNLFEMLKTEVMFIKSITSRPFTVYATKVFPGMAESTFLSRSFGDQGVRLRIRKEPRSLCKRPASNLRSDEFASGLEDPAPPAQPDLTQHTCGRTPMGMYASRYGNLPDEPSAKRQRTSVDMSDRPLFDAERYSQRTYTDHRNPYNTYIPGQQLTNTYAPSYSQGSQSALSNMSDFSFGHQRNNSSNTSSPFVSPHTDVSGSSWPGSSLYYQNTVKDPMYPYSQPQYSQSQYSQAPYSEMQPPRPPQASDNLTRQRGPDLSGRLQMNPNFAFPRPQDSETAAAGGYNQLARSLPTSSNYNDPSPRLPSTDQISDLAASNHQQYPGTTLSNVLPPIEPSVNSGQHRGPSQILSSNIIPSIEPQTIMSSQSAQERESESYDSAYTLPLPNQKESDEG